MKCPVCNQKVDLHWDKVLWCPDCQMAFLKSDGRYYLSCPKDEGVLVPRVSYDRPVVYCMKCKTEFDIPTEGVPEIVEETLD